MLLEGFDSKGKRANKLIMAMEKSKTVPFDKFLFALGIGEVGVKTAKDLASKFDSFETLKNASIEDILAVRNIGDVVAENIYNFFHNEENLEQIQKLFDYGVRIVYPEKKQFKNTVFDGKTVVLTGTLNSLTRKSATELLESLNATVTNTISKNTNFLIAGENAGSKLAKAKSIGIQILTEQEFLDIIA
jgi:DNA ligase (NAD+)